MRIPAPGSLSHLPLAAPQVPEPRTDPGWGQGCAEGRIILESSTTGEAEPAPAAAPEPSLHSLGI